MEEKNELNDIILNKGGSGSNSKKLLLAIAALTLILIIVLVIMNSLKSESEEQPPHAAVPPEPSAPTEIVDDPLFEPVEVIQEGSNTTGGQDLGQIAQKIKQESFDTPVEEKTIEPASAPVVEKAAPIVQKAAPAAPVSQPAPAPKPAVQKVEAKPVVQSAPKPAPKAAEPVVNTPTIKTVKPAETKKAATPAPKPAAEPAPAKTETKVESKAEAKPAEAAPKAADTTGTYYIQVGSFSKEPSKALFERLNASGLKYTSVPSGNVTKVMVGPFQGQKAAREVLGTVRKNVEANAFIVKG